MSIVFRLTLMVLSLAPTSIAQDQDLPVGNPSYIKLLCDARAEEGRRPFGEEKSIVKYSQPCFCYFFLERCKLVSNCPPTENPERDCQEVCEVSKTYEEVETEEEGNSGDDLGPESVMTLCKEEEEIWRQELGEKKCLIKYRRKCGCVQDRTSGSSPKEGVSCECTDRLCKEDFEFYKIEEKGDGDNDGSGDTGGGDNGGGDTGGGDTGGGDTGGGDNGGGDTGGGDNGGGDTGGGDNGGGDNGGGDNGGGDNDEAVKPGPAAPSYRSKEEFLCKPCFDRYEWFVEEGQDLADGTITQCVKRFSMECGCMLDGNGNVVPKPGVDCECMPLGCSLRGTFPDGVETFTIPCSRAECTEARNNGANDYYP